MGGKWSKIIYKFRSFMGVGGEREKHYLHFLVDIQSVVQITGIYIHEAVENMGVRNDLAGK